MRLEGHEAIIASPIIHIILVAKDRRSSPIQQIYVSSVSKRQQMEENFVQNFMSDLLKSRIRSPY